MHVLRNSRQNIPRQKRLLVCCLQNLVDASWLFLSIHELCESISIITTNAIYLNNLHFVLSIYLPTIIIYSVKVNVY